MRFEIKILLSFLQAADDNICTVIYFTPTTLPGPAKYQTIQAAA
jgi:hypothetical protein